MKFILKHILIIRIGVATPLLSGCSGPGAIDTEPEYRISGTVIVPDSIQAMMLQNSGLTGMLLATFPDTANTRMTGNNTVVANATVELVELHDNGFTVIDYMKPDSAVTDKNGRFSISTNKLPSSNLLLRVTVGAGSSLHALVAGEYTDINVASEYAYSLVMENVRTDSESFLPYFSGIELENIVASIEALDVDLTGVDSTAAAINLIRMVDGGAIASEIAQASSPNLGGEWRYIKKSGSNSCGNPVGIELINTSIFVDQVNDALTIYIDGSVFSTATLFGRSIVDFKLETYPENGGTLIQSSSTMTVATDNRSVDGNVSWDWFGPEYDCSGIDIVSVIRE